MRRGTQTLEQASQSFRQTMPQAEALQSESLPDEHSKPMCDTCGDVGFVRLDVPFGDPRFGKLMRCTCKAQEDANRLQRLSGLTPTERTVRLSDIDVVDRPATAAMVRECAKFLDHPYGFVTIHGTSGNAKTVALQACVNAMVSSGVDAVYITAFDLISYIRDAFDDKKEVKSDSAYARIVRFGTVSFLAIDELDKVKWTSWVEEQVTDLIDRRYRLGMNEQAGTMLAMNGDPQAMPMWIYSRLSQGRIVRNDDSDLRPYLGARQ